MYKELSTPLNFPELEKKILSYWQEERVFEKSIESRDENKQFVFYEGPPTANGKPGIHHVISRTIKDFVCRLKTMQGFRVERKAGWDTHGLPVEIQVEQQLGFKSKDEIEKYGIDKFNARCRESVWQYKSDWDELTKRIGFWIDLEQPYITYENDYIESVWWILNQLWQKDLIYRGHKIIPYCPRCETPLSSHEVSQGYQDVEDPSVYVTMPIKGEERTAFLVWTTTPWTLISNVAIAVNPEIKYVKIRQHDEYLILAEARLDIIDGEYEIVGEYRGKDLAGKEYEPLFTYLSSDKKLFYAVEGDFVSTDDGSGIVHIAPAFGEDDYRTGQEYDLPVLQPVDSSGKFMPEVEDFKDIFVKTADPLIIENLKVRRRLYKVEKYLHSYPHCWRCASPLLYYAKQSWFIKTTAIKERLIANNRLVEWYPKEVGAGRFGEWLENNIDWSLSRDRYWGTPLPIWLCADCETFRCIGSVDELQELAGLTDLQDLHKPYIDEVSIPCDKCGAAMQRTPEVIDVWFDSGSMPVAQWHYPFENKERFERSFPADFISEGVDQTRGWFYSLLAIATMVFDQPCYKRCLSNDLILDRHGQKMSKSKGNTVEPNSILDRYGADALRWYLLSVSPPWVPTRFDTEGVAEIVRKFLGTIVNVYSFFAIYTNIDKFVYEQATVAIERRAEIDRWLVSSSNALVENVENLLERYDLTKAARAISQFVIDDLSNWYVRRCRRRFWKSELGEDKLAAYETLYEVLFTLARLMAPFAPFISEEIYLNLATTNGRSGTSVHLSTYPESASHEHRYRDTALEERMNLVRRVVLSGRLLRNESGIKVRQPLARIIIVAEDDKIRAQIKDMTQLILEELNIKGIEFVQDVDELTNKKAVPQFNKIGPKFGKNAKAAAEEIRGMNRDQIAELEASNSVTVTVAGQNISIAKEDVEIVSESAEGLIVQNENELTVALDIQIDMQLKQEGLAREFVNRIQNMRKNAGFDVVDRINIYTDLSEELAQAVEKQTDYICHETLAQSISGEIVDTGVSQEWEIDGGRALIAIEKVSE
jgi:isoleucyl-tRNA synthetase